MQNKCLKYFFRVLKYHMEIIYCKFKMITICFFYRIVIQKNMFYYEYSVTDLLKKKTQHFL